VILLDKWTCNADGGQAVFARKSTAESSPPRSSTAGIASMRANRLSRTRHCWGVYAKNCLYKNVRGWDDFEPALTRAEEMGSNGIWEITRVIEVLPSRWSAQFIRSL
jgi:hypothetical protein